MRKFRKIFGCLSALLVLSGCATERQNMELSKEFLKKPSTVVVTQISGLEKPSFYKKGNQGVLDLIISEEMTSSVAGEIQKIDAKPIVEQYYYQPFYESLKTHSLNPIKEVTSINEKQLVRASNDDIKYAPYNFKTINSHGAEYVLVLQPNAFGTERPYYGFIPTGAPSGYTDITVYLVKVEDNTLAGYYKTSVNIPVKGEWDTPPHYNELVTASKNSLIEALKNAHNYFFNGQSQGLIAQK